MATVFLCWDTKLKVWRAVKALLPDFVRKSKVRRRFENEAHAMARLEHPNIIRVYDVGVERTVPYMVMEYAPGGCIIDWLETHGAMPPALACQVMVQICHGIQAAHDAGIVHRDIKPHNILVNRKGVCKMTDFGIAQVMENDSLTKTGSVMGTWGYMAPEQRTDAKAVDERADVFSLGATLYSLLTAKTPTELYVADEDDDVFDGVSPAMLEIILKACSYKADKRHADVREFGNDVLALATDLPSIPEGTPSLIMPTEQLPDAIEGMVMSDEIIADLHETLALPADEADEPTMHARRNTPLPYYGAVPAVVDPEPDMQLPSADEMASFLQSELPAFEPPANTFEQPVETPVPAPLPPTPPPAPPVKAPAPSPVPAPSIVTPAPPPRPLDAADIALRVLSVMLVFGIAFIAVLAFGMMQVNAAHDVALQQSRPIHAVMLDDVQGPIIDGLALAGADKASLEATLATYNAEKTVTHARAHIRLVNGIVKGLHDAPSIGSLLPEVQRMQAAEQTYLVAERDWANTSQSFPGAIAVGLGLSQSPR